MPKMTAAEAAIRVLESEGVDLVFGQPGAAILPFYQAMRARGTIRHVLVRHEEGGTHAAEGYSRASDQKIGVSIGTSGPAGTNMITGLYSAMADSIPILAITGQAPASDLFAKACESCRSFEAMADIHASADYRKHLLAQLAKRALRTALAMKG